MIYISSLQRAQIFTAKATKRQKKWHLLPEDNLYHHDYGRVYCNNDYSSYQTINNSSIMMGVPSLYEV